MKTISFEVHYYGNTDTLIIIPLKNIDVSLEFEDNGWDSINEILKNNSNKH